MMAKPAWAGFLSAIVLTFICAGIYAFSERADVAKATLSEVNTIVGVDTNTTGNTATTVGTIDRCVSVNPNSTFYIDLFVKDVTDLNYWEGALKFDGSIVRVTSLDVQYFLATTPGSDVSPYSDPIPNSSGSWLASAFDYGKDPETGARFPESGSGVLARVGLLALNAGTSRLYFTWTSSISGVILRNDHDAVIGDRDEDTYFDGLVFNAMVVVGAPCPTDADNDGFTNVEESVDGSDLLNATSTPEMCDGEDNDQDGLTDEWYDRDPVNDIPDCQELLSDTDDDDDGFSDVLEAYLATDSLANCPGHPYHYAPQYPYHSAWPLDLDNSGDITVTGDVFNFVGSIGTQYGDPNFRRRLDFDGSHDISVTGDVFLYVGRVGQTCS